MGDIADMILDGTLCQECGSFMGGSTGYPRTCRSCSGQLRLPCVSAKPKVACPTCGKRVKKNGLADHQRDAHQKVAA